MKRVAVASSAVRSIGYDEERLLLEVRYVDGDLYRYFEVPLSVAKALAAASSKGTFINRVIKKYFRTKKVTTDEKQRHASVPHTPRPPRKKKPFRFTVIN